MWILLPVGDIFVPFRFHDEDDEQNEKKDYTWEEIDAIQKNNNKGCWAVVFLMIAVNVGTII